MDTIFPFRPQGTGVLCKAGLAKGAGGVEIHARHRAVAVLGRGVLSNSHRGALTAAQGSHMREGLVPTGLRSSSKRQQMAEGPE